MTPYIELLRAGRVPPSTLYLLVGADVTVHQDVVGRLTRGLVQNPELNAMHLRAADSTRFDEIEAFAEEYPMLSKRRLIWIDGSDKLPAATRAALAAYLPRRNESTVLVLSAGQGADARKKPSAKKKDTGESPEEVASDMGVCIQCDIRAPRMPGDRTPDDRAPWLALELERRRVAVNNDARQALLGRLGNTLAELRSELDKLQAYVGERSPVTRADVEAVVCRSVVGSMQELSGLLQRRQTEGLLRLVHELMQGGAAPFQIMSYVGAILRPAASVPALQAMVEAEVAAKSGTDPKLALELMLLSACQPGLRSPLAPVLRPRR